jgi:hypothetical protein
MVLAAAHAIPTTASSIVAARNAAKSVADLRGEFMDLSSSACRATSGANADYRTPTRTFEGLQRANEIQSESSGGGIEDSD